MVNQKVSVIMSTYNSEKTISFAIDSIINQSYKNWEFIICDDASTDNTYDILMRYKEKYSTQFIIIRNEKNSKLSYSLNRCLNLASGQLIARMDADDISAENRFECQVEFLNKYKNVDLVGTYMQRFNEKKFNDVVGVVEKPNIFSLKNGAPFFHATIMTHKYVFDKLNGYKVSKLTERSQDLELWSRFFYDGFIGENIAKPLYFVREDIDAIKRRTLKVRFNGLLLRLKAYKLLGYPRMWYIKPIILFFIKISTPYKIQEMYRWYQASKRTLN